MMPGSKQLAIYLQNELKNLDQLARLAARRVDAGHIHPDQADAFIESAALHLQSFYTAVEQILSHVAVNVDEAMPDGSAWHVDLLRQMTYEVPGRRPPVLRPETHDQLDELRGFRHRVRNLYTFQLNPERVEFLVSELPKTFKLLSEDLDGFIRFLESL